MTYGKPVLSLLPLLTIKSYTNQCNENKKHPFERWLSCKWSNTLCFPFSVLSIWQLSSASFTSNTFHHWCSISTRGHTLKSCEMEKLKSVPLHHLWVKSRAPAQLKWLLLLLLPLIPVVFKPSRWQQLVNLFSDRWYLTPAHVCPALRLRISSGLFFIWLSKHLSVTF